MEDNDNNYWGDEFNFEPGESNRYLRNIDWKKPTVTPGTKTMDPRRAQEEKISVNAEGSEWYIKITVTIPINPAHPPGKARLILHYTSAGSESLYTDLGNNNNNSFNINNSEDLKWLLKHHTQSR